MSSNGLVQRLWNYCNVLRDDGLSYGDYLEQLTYLLFLKDALQRANVLVDATGGHLGGLRDVNVGVFQVTAPNSTEVSDYGVYDTSTLRKDVTAVVNVSFALK